MVSSTLERMGSVGNLATTSVEGYFDAIDGVMVCASISRYAVVLSVTDDALSCAPSAF